jgi:hypothetical protein
VLLDKEHVGKLWFGAEGDAISLGGERKKRKLTWKVLRISSFDDSCEATSMPVELAADGEWRVCDEFLVRDEAGKNWKRITKSTSGGLLLPTCEILRNPNAPII